MKRGSRISEEEQHGGAALLQRALVHLGPRDDANSNLTRAPCPFWCVAESSRIRLPHGMEPDDGGDARRAALCTPHRRQVSTAPYGWLTDWDGTRMWRADPAALADEVDLGELQGSPLVASSCIDLQARSPPLVTCTLHLHLHPPPSPSPSPSTRKISSSTRRDR